MPLLRCNNEAIYTNVPGAGISVETPAATNGLLLFVPKMQIATPIAAVVPTRLELINSPVLVLHLVQSPPLIRVNCASYAINALIATLLRAFDDCCDLMIEPPHKRIVTRMQNASRISEICFLRRFSRVKPRAQKPQRGTRYFT